MISITIKGPNTLNNIINHRSIELPIEKQRIFIGRGEEILQGDDQNNHVINLANISQSISRMHASIIFSPRFLERNTKVPGYFQTFRGKWSELPNTLLYNIWQYVKPCKKILLKDLNSKTGIYKKIKSQTIESNTHIVLGDSRPIIFHHQEIYQDKASMLRRINQLKQKEYTTLNDHLIENNACSFWILSVRQQSFILINQKDRISIGRSSDCNFVMNQVSISRKHAFLEYVNGWIIHDGNGVSGSSNGSWKRVKKLQLSYRKQDGYVTGQNVAKIGDVLFTFQIKQDFTFLNLSELLNQTAQNNNNNQESFLPKELLLNQQTSFPSQ